MIPPHQPVEVEALEEYEVFGILGDKYTGRRKYLEYLVSFTVCNSAANEWLPESYLENV